MSKFVKLLTSAYVNGVLRHPHEGVLHISDEEADRLFENDSAEDVSDDFTAKEDKAVPVDAITVDAGEQPAPPEHPHQAEIAPETAAPEPKKARKGD